MRQPHHSYAPAEFAPNTSSWPGTAFPDASFSVGGIWPGNQGLDDVRYGSMFGAPGGNADGSGMNLMGTTPVLEQAFPAASMALPASQPYPPPMNWPQAPGPSWQPTSSWDHPVHTVRQHSDHNSSVGSLGMRPVFQLPTSSVISGHSERRLMMPTGPLPSITTPDSVRPSTFTNPVPDACTSLFAVVNSFFFGIRTHVSHSTCTPFAWRTVGPLKRDHVPMSVDKPVRSAYRRKQKERDKSPAGRAQFRARRAGDCMCVE